MNERSQYRFGQPMAPAAGGLVNVAGNGTGSLLWCMPFGAQTPASWAALSAGHYMERYGVTNRDLGYVSVAQRKHAATNPLAWFYGKPITLEDHQASKWIVEPVLRLLDCCQESDGGVAIVITSLERARDGKAEAGAHRLLRAVDPGGGRGDLQLLPRGPRRDARGGRAWPSACTGARD